MTSIKLAANLSVWASALLVLGACVGPFAKKSGKSGGAFAPPATTDTSTSTATGTKTSGGGAESEEPSPGVDGEDGESIPSNNQSAFKGETGCIQGVVVDGYTGQKLDLAAAAQTANNGVFVLIAGKKYKASYFKAEEDANLVGEYWACGVPVEESYPVFVLIDGYLPFTGVAKIVAYRAKTGTTQTAIDDEYRIPNPIKLANVIVFPKNTAVRDLTVNVFHNGAPVKDVIVDLEPTNGTGHFAWDAADNLLANTSFRLLPQRGTTAADGTVTFAAGELSLGSEYRLRLTPPAASELVPPAVDTFLFGINGAAPSDDKDAYVLNYELTPRDKELRIISCSLEHQDYNASGQLSVIFNREVVIRNANAWQATLANAPLQTAGPAAPALKTRDTTNDVAEELTITGSGTARLVLAPVWASNDQRPKPVDFNKAPLHADNANRDATVTYSLGSISVAVVGDGNNNEVKLNAVNGVAKCAGGVVRLFPDFEN